MKTWNDSKKDVIDLIEKLGFSQRGKSQLWTHTLENNPMICVIDLSKIPGPMHKMDIFLLDQERPTEREYTDHDNIVHDTQESISALLNPLEKTPSKPERPKNQNVEPIKETPNVPAEVPKSRTPAKDSPRKVDPKIERKMEDKKTKEFLQQRGSSYSVSGKDRPDAHAIQHVANATDMDTEILIAEQNDKQCKAVVRAHLGDRYIDAVVIHDFGVERQLKTMEMIKNRPEILDHFEGLIPVIREDATVKMKTDKGWEEVPASYFMIHALLHQRRFAIRDAITKASAIAQSKMLNREDWRDPEEVDMEYEERNMVQNSIETRKAQRMA
jgi:hypothetical protein